MRIIIIPVINHQGSLLLRVLLPIFRAALATVLLVYPCILYQTLLSTPLLFNFCSPSHNA